MKNLSVDFLDTRSTNLEAFIIDGFEESSFQFMGGYSTSKGNNEDDLGYRFRSRIIISMNKKFTHWFQFGCEDHNIRFWTDKKIKQLCKSNKELGLFDEIKFLVKLSKGTFSKIRNRYKLNVSR